MTQSHETRKNATQASGPGRGVARALAALTAAALAFTLASCAQTVNPATGRVERTSLSASDEQRIGDDQHPKILEQFGGVYDDPRVAGYVAEIGGRLAVNSELPGQRWTFTVLDSPVVNAFALPGGYVYVTRGLVALANDEAELAGVLGHEIGHVTARHTARRIDRAQTASLVGVLATIGAAAAGVDPRSVGQVAQVAGQGYLADFSREQEFEADQLGVRYLSRVGYDPYAQADFLDTLAAQSTLSAQISGRAYDANRVDFFSTHPATAERVRQAAAAAQAQGAAAVGAPRRREEFLAVIDGMTYGDSPEQGFVKGRRFVHPSLAFEWVAPPGFRLVNGARSVVAAGANGERIQFDADRPYRGPMTDYIERVWAPAIAERARVSRPEGFATFDANGLPGATAVMQIAGQNGPLEARLIAIGDTDYTFRFTALYPAGQSAAMDEPLRRLTFGFRRLSAREAAAERPYRLDIVTVRAGDTVESLAARSVFDDEFAVERFRVLNGLRPGARLREGQRVKIVRE